VDISVVIDDGWSSLFLKPLEITIRFSSDINPYKVDIHNLNLSGYSKFLPDMFERKRKLLFRPKEYMRFLKNAKEQKVKYQIPFEFENTFI
jgi:hypothetical protein